MPEYPTKHLLPFKLWELTGKGFWEDLEPKDREIIQKYQRETGQKSIDSGNPKKES